MSSKAAGAGWPCKRRCAAASDLRTCDIETGVRWGATVRATRFPFAARPEATRPLAGPRNAGRAERATDGLNATRRYVARSVPRHSKVTCPRSDRKDEHHLAAEPDSGRPHVSGPTPTRQGVGTSTHKGAITLTPTRIFTLRSRRVTMKVFVGHHVRAHMRRWQANTRVRYSNCLWRCSCLDSIWASATAVTPNGKVLASTLNTNTSPSEQRARVATTPNVLQPPTKGAVIAPLVPM